VDGWIATDGQLYRRLGTQEFGDPVKQSRFEHVPFLGKPGLMRPLRLALVPTPSTIYKQIQIDGETYSHSIVNERSKLLI